MLRTRIIALLLGSLIAQISFAASDSCPSWMNETRRLLRSENSKNLCDAYGGKPLLIVNTASHCGFTPQFKGLEALNQKYKAQGLVIIGFPSDDFKQEENEEELTAKVCYGNYGVTFDMYAPISVRGDSADPIFKALAQQGGGFPKWNFYKYLVDRNGVVVKRFSSKDKPEDEDVQQAIEAVVAKKP